MASIFTRIINRDIPAYIMAEDDKHMAILDINPLTFGHVLVFPKQEIDYLFDLEDSVYLQLMTFSKNIASKLKQTVPCKRIGVSVIGLEVPHVHVHLIPMNSINDMNFSRQKLALDAEKAKVLVETFNSIV